MACSRPASPERQLLADSGFTTVQVRCRLSARWLTFNRATEMRAEGLGLFASISISAPGTHRPCGQFRCRHLHSSAERRQGDYRGTGGENYVTNPGLYAAWKVTPRYWAIMGVWAGSLGRGALSVTVLSIIKRTVSLDRSRIVEPRP